MSAGITSVDDVIKDLQSLEWLGQSFHCVICWFCLQDAENVCTQEGCHMYIKQRLFWQQHEALFKCAFPVILWTMIL